jgi:hypothetical protein
LAVNKLSRTHRLALAPIFKPSRIVWNVGQVLIKRAELLYYRPKVRVRMLQPNQVTRSLRRRCPKHPLAKHSGLLNLRLAPALGLRGFKICLKLLAAHRHQIALLSEFLLRQRVLSGSLLPSGEPCV